jgi:molybdenum cofactor sulfurtransferase
MTPASKTLIESFCEEMRTTLLFNPNSDASDLSPSSSIVAETRLEVLEFLNANPDHFDVVFTADVTAAVKLVMEYSSMLSI